MIRIINSLKVACLALVALVALNVDSAEAQGKAVSVSGNAYVGGEDLTGRPTKLGFAFRNDGTAVMIDDVTPNPVNGNWRQDGDQVTITFGNCTYRGRVQGNQIVGTATMNGRAGAWNFAVQFAPPERK